MEETKHQLHNTTMAAYAMLFAGLLMQYSGIDIVLLSGGAVMTLGIIIVYWKRRTVRDSYLESHYHYLVRTFWIGGLILCLGMLTSVSMLLGEMDINTLASAGEHPQHFNDVVQDLIADKKIALFLPQLPGILWWSWRCIKGMRTLKANQPIGKPAANAHEAI